MKWFEQKKRERSREDLERQQPKASSEAPAGEPKDPPAEPTNPPTERLDEEEDLMNMETPDVRLQTTHQEWYQQYVKGATRNLLHGRFDPNVSTKETKFIRNHKLQDLYNDDECILLFELPDEEKFR